jgi:hypothetical protein
LAADVVGGAERTKGTECVAHFLASAVCDTSSN